MLKKILCLSLLLLGACSAPKSPEQSEKIRVLATTEMIGDLVRAVGGDQIESQTLIFGEMDPHSYELVKGDDEKLLSSQIVFYNGLGLEHGASLRYQIQHHPNSVAVGEAIDSNERLYIDGQVDPHIWMDISLWKQCVPAIVDALSQMDPEHAALFHERSIDLMNRMQEKHDKVRATLQEVPEKRRFLVTSHDAFNYFTRAYLATDEEQIGGGWQHRFAAPEGLSPDGQLSSQDIRDIVDHLLKYRILLVYPESNVSRDSLRKIVEVASKKGLQVKFSAGPLYGDAMGPQGSGAETYLGMIHHNAELLKREWMDEERF